MNIFTELEKYNLSPAKYEQLLKDCSDKTFKISDLDWGEISNKYGLEWNPDTLRKASTTILGGSYVREFYEDKIKNTLISDDEVLYKLRKERQELQKERQKLQDERTSLRKELREQARRESMYEIMKRAIDEYEFVKFDYSPPTFEALSGNDLIIHLTDLHAGIDVNNAFNEFNTKILEERLKLYLNEIIDIRDIYDAENAFVIIGGDLIQGLIHLNGRIEAKENIVQQIMVVSDLVSNFIYELSKMFNCVDVYSTAGNHSRVCENKEHVAKGENFDLLIPYYCKKALHAIRNIKIHDNYLDYDIATFCVRGHMVYAVHGEKDTAKTIVYNMIKFARKANLPLPDMCYLGHRHTNGLTTVDDVKVIESGCVSGMDNHTINMRLVGSPEQTVTVVSKEKRIKALCDIQLD